MCSGPETQRCRCALRTTGRAGRGRAFRLAYLESHTAPPPGWQARQMSILDAAAQPSALVRFTVLYSMRKLVLAAAQTEPALAN